MLKGVSREVIEITDTGSEFFERAVLFIRPGIAPTNSTEIAEKGSRYLESLQSDNRSYRPSVKNNLPFVASVSAIFGAVVSYFAMLLL